MRGQLEALQQAVKELQAGPKSPPASAARDGGISGGSVKMLKQAMERVSKMEMDMKDGERRSTTQHSALLKNLRGIEQARLACASLGSGNRL